MQLNSNTQTLENLREFYRDKLFAECLPFWIDHAIDHEYGGFWTCLDRVGKVIDTDKNVWQQARFTWLLAELFNEPTLGSLAERPGWLTTATQGANFLEKFCFDPSDGRMWFHLDRQGNPIRKRRYAFSESFAAIAFGELAKATGKAHYRLLAQDCFQRFLEHNRNPEKALQKYTDHRKTRTLGFPMISIGTAQELRSSIDFPGANSLVDAAISEIRDNFVKPEMQCVLETVLSTGELLDHFDGRTLNPGHAIEAAWFIIEEGRLRNIQSYVDLGCQMLDWMWERGWDSTYGGLLYFVDLHGGCVQEYWHDMKFWWPHNEAVLATLLAYSVTQEERYLGWHQKIHDWSYAHFQDQHPGEWFGYLHRDGRISATLKGNHWKGPFHYPRMLLNCIRILDRVLSQPGPGVS
ncbi:MAG: AGE family epimerase/isomerase [Planctomycetota bacterium]|nr:AGE family epimerase/isomerase [Planctomycetota bacterium]